MPRKETDPSFAHPGPHLTPPERRIHRPYKPIAALVLLALLLSSSPLALAQQAEVSAEDASAAAAVSVGRWLGVVEEGGDADARATLVVALDFAGEAGVRVLLDRLARDSTQPRAAAACWALGEALRPRGLEPQATGAARDEAVSALRGALASPSADVRLAASSTLGLLEAQEAEAELLDLLLSPGLPPGAEDVLLLSLAGTRGAGLAQLEARLERGGGETWARATTISFLRWGGDAWPELLRYASDSPAAAVRATAVTSLLLLAEPASACGMTELYGSEPEPQLRRVLLQAIAATRHPTARDFLGLVARTETEPQLKEAAGLLAAGLIRERARKREAPKGPVRSVPDLLAEIEGGSAFARQLDEVELRADPVHAKMIAVVLRRLALRADERTLEDHARLAQVRARLLCLDGIDCGAQ